jgi:hypothetical protein
VQQMSQKICPVCLERIKDYGFLCNQLMQGLIDYGRVTWSDEGPKKTILRFLESKRIIKKIKTNTDLFEARLYVPESHCAGDPLCWCEDKI